MKLGNGAVFAAIMGGAALLGVVGAGGSGARDSAAADPAAVAPAPLAPTPLAAATVAKCRGLIEQGRKAGVIRARPDPARIDVEDAAWAALPAETKRGLLSAVACDVFGRAHLVDLEGPVVAYGYRSGKRVALLSAAGVSFE